MYQGEDRSWRDRPRLMGSDVVDALCSRLISQARIQEAGFAIVLHGGEPLLIGYERVRELVSKLRDVLLDPTRYPISVQTNGMLLNNRKLLDLFSEMRVSVSVSIDGPQHVNDIGRVNKKKEGTFSKTLDGIRALDRHSDREFLFAGTLSVVQPTSSAKEVYDFFKSLGSPSMDFLLQDGNYDRMPCGKASFSSTEYGDWLCELFECYILDRNPVPIRVFDDIIRLLLGESSIKEGRGTNPYGILIIESDGEIRKNDTLRSSFDGADSFSSHWNIKTIEISEVLRSEEFISYTKMQIPTSEECNACQYIGICGGGMPLYRWSKSKGYDAPSIYCQDHIKLINTISSALKKEGCR